MPSTASPKIPSTNALNMFHLNQCPQQMTAGGDLTQIDTLKTSPKKQMPSTRCPLNMYPTWDDTSSYRWIRQMILQLSIFFLFCFIFNMTKSRKIKFENVPRSKILCWLRKSQSFFWYINRLKDIWTNGKSRYWCGKTGFPVFLVILQEWKYFLE